MSDLSNYHVKIYLIILLFSFFILFCFLGWGGAEINFEGRMIPWVALLWSVFTLAVGGMSERLFWQFAPFALFFTPNAVNDFWPSLPMTTGGGGPDFPFFTHIDFYFLMGIFFYCDFRQKTTINRLIILLVILFISTLVFIGGGVYGNFWQVLQGGFQLRYLIFLYLLFIYAHPLSYEKEFSGSFKVVLFLIILEAVVSTLLNGNHRMTSGNYGANSLGHMLAAGAAFILLQAKSHSKSNIRYLLVLLLIIAILTTATRFSFIALFLGFLVSMLFVLKRGNFIRGFIGIAIVFAILTSFLLYSSAGKSMVSGLLMIGENFLDPSSISVTVDSSSMVTRLKLWLSTIDMISDAPWLGVGPGVWSFLKGGYGVEFDSVLDPHQDLLNYLVSYGILPGATLYFIIFILPIIKFSKFSQKMDDLPWNWLGIVVVLFFAGATNAVTWKHQIAALVYFSSLVVVFHTSRPIKKHV